MADTWRISKIEIGTVRQPELFQNEPVTRSCQPHQKIQRRTMKKPVPNPDSQNNLVRPVASKPDPRDRALLEETLAAVRELRDLLRGSATDPEDKVLPALRQLESRLKALPEALRGTIRQAVDDCLTAASQETRKTKPSGDAPVEEEIAGNRIEAAIYLVERNLLKSLDSHGESTYQLFEEAGKRDKEITDQIEKIHPALRSIDNQVSRLTTSISENRSHTNSYLIWMLIPAAAGMLVEFVFHPIRQLVYLLGGV